MATRTAKTNSKGNSKKAKTSSEKKKTKARAKAVTPVSPEGLDNVTSIPNLVTNVALLNLTEQVESLKDQQRQICEQAIRSILHALDCKDHYTFGHSLRVTYYALKLGEEYGLEPEELYNLEVAALFHDIGKIAIPDAVLLKPSRLEEEEFLIMKTHPSKSAEILEGFEPFQEAAQFAKHHHERYDGRGYPDALKGGDIPLFSRIILIADTFDAMTSTRPYRKGLPYEVAFSELDEFSGSQFDPDLVKHFISVMKKEEAKNEPTFQLSIIEGKWEKDAA